MKLVLEFLQIIFVICLFLLPAVLLAALLRLPQVYRLTQRDRSTRTGLVLGNAFLCFGIYYGALTWLAAEGIYSIAKFYFDSSFGLEQGFTLAQVEQHKWGVINELWLRGLLFAGSGQSCFSGNETVCQLADIAGKISSPASFSSILLIAALFAALIVFLLGWRFTRPRVEQR